MYALGIDIGGTRIKYVAVTQETKTLHSGSVPTRDGAEAADTWKLHVSEIRDMLELKFGKARAIGVASPGLAALDGLSIAWMQGRMQCVQGLNWSEALGGESPIPVLNDAHAALLGEAWCGAAAGCPNAAMLTLGTGVGGGCLVDGKLLCGAIGRAGHLGHITVNYSGPPDIVNTPGSLEDAIGECTLLARSNGRFASTSALMAAHRAGDAEATQIWMRSLHALAAGVVSIINVTDPEVFIIGGGVAQSGSDLFVPLQELVNEYEWRPLGGSVRIVSATLGEFAGAYGAAARSAAWL